MNQQPVNEYYSPCGKCPEYLNSCIPVIINGYIFIEKMKKANMLFWIQNNIYMVVLSINTGVMFGGDGYLSNNVLSFTPDFAKAFYDKIFEHFPELELYPEYREQGYKELWNTGKSPEILKMYYDLNSFKLRRIDYTFDILTSPEQYIQLLEWGKSIRRKSFERQYFDDEVDDLIEEDVDDLIEDENRILMIYKNYLMNIPLLQNTFILNPNP